MPGAEHRRLSSALKGAKSDTERHLILKAVAARSQRLSDPKQATAAMNEVTAFAAEIRGLKKDVLRQRTSMIDRDATKNSSRFDPRSLRKYEGGLDRFDRDATNDGHFQRFTGSCGASSAQVLRGQADPIYAYRMRTRGFANPNAGTPIAEEQRKLLNAAGGTPELLAGQQAAMRAARTLGKLQAKGKITSAQRRDLAGVLRGSGRVTAAARRALKVLRGSTSGFPKAGQLLAIRRFHAGGVGHGTYPSAHRAVLDRHVGEVTGARYRTVAIGRGKLGKVLPKMAKALVQGHDLTIQFNDPDHWMSVTDVRGKAGKRAFRVHDTLTGRTRWVPARHLVDGSMMRRHFAATGKGRVALVMLPR